MVLYKYWFYISTECQADLWPFIQGHSFGLPHDDKYLNIFFSEITWLYKLKFHMEYSFDCSRSFDQNGCNPPYMVKQNFNDKPKLTLTYFNIIKKIR